MFFFLLTLSGIRQRLFDSIPECLKIGVQCGIGMFIAFIGLKNAGLIVDHPATLVTMSELPSAGGLLALGGFLVMVILQVRGLPGALLLGIIGVTLAGIWVPTGEEGAVTQLPGDWVSKPASLAPTFLQIDFMYPFRNPGIAFPIVFAFLFVDLFDTLGTLVGVTRGAGLLDDRGQFPRVKQALMADSAATIGGAILGTSTVTSYVESSAGVRAGGRTGLTAIVVAGCFLVALFFSPLILSIPAVATAPALLVIGLMMMEGLKDLDWGDLSQAVPALAVVVIMPFAFSISEGIAIGFILYAALMTGTGQAGKLKILTWILSGLFLCRYLWP